jgi:hypothetical protein
LIGGKIDLDLSSLFPQKDARNIGEMERESKLLKVNNGGERERGSSNQPKVEEGGFYSPPQNMAVAGFFRPDYPAPGAKIRPPYWEPCPKVLSRNSRVGLFK